MKNKTSEVFNLGEVIEILPSGKVVVEWTSTTTGEKIRKDYDPEELKKLSSH